MNAAEAARLESAAATDLAAHARDWLFEAAAHRWSVVLGRGGAALS